MRFFYFILLVSIFLSSKNIKVATYNVENLFDDVDNGNEYKEYKLNKHNWNSNIFKKKLLNITKVICDLNADILALQEVENENALNNLLKNLNRVGCKYRYSAITHKTESAIQVALISKLKIKSYRDIIVSNNKRDRNILEVVLDTTPKLTIFVNHWRSKRAKESYRVKYAKTLMKRIEKLPSSSEYIILGDFNSRYNECFNLEDRFNDTNGVCGVDTILKTYYKDSLLKLRDKMDFNTTYHYNLWSEVMPYNRWSHNFYGKKEAIDSIIIPRTLIDNKGWHYIKNSFKVFKKSYLFKKYKNWIFSWEYKNSKHTGRGYSDHLPIFANFSNSNRDELKYETIKDKFFKLFIPHKKTEINKRVVKEKIQELKLENLSNISKIKTPFILTDACVIFKRGDSAVVKSTPYSKPITLYRCAEPLKEGSCYKLKVYKAKTYFGVEEILDIDKMESYEKIDTNSYIEDFKVNNFDKLLVGSIVKNIEGIYKKGYLYINGKGIKIYFKEKKRGILRKNSKLYIKKAQIGYYKGEKELIVYSINDVVKE